MERPETVDLHGCGVESDAQFRSAYSAIFDFSDFDWEHEERHALKVLEQLNWDLDGQGSVHDTLAQLWVVARIHFDLGLVQEALREPEHDQHQQALVWNESAGYKGRQRYVNALLSKARERIHKGWELARREHEKAGLGVCPSLEAAIYGMEWPARGQTHSFKVVHQDETKDAVALAGLIDRFFSLRDRLLEWVKPDCERRLELERPNKGGDFALEEANQRLCDDWVATCWRYIEIFEEIEKLWEQAGRQTLASKEMERFLGIPRSRQLPEVTLKTWLDNPHLELAWSRLEPYSSVADLETPEDIYSYVQHLNAFKEELARFHPEQMPIPRLQDYKEEMGYPDELLGAYHDELVSLEDRLRRCEALLGSAYVHLAGYADLDEGVARYCRAALTRSCLYRIAMGDYVPLSNRYLLNLAETLHAESLEVEVVRARAAYGLMMALPSLSDIFTAMKGLDQKQRRHAFLRTSFAEHQVLRGRLRARLGEALDLADQRDARYYFFGLDPERASRWQEAFDDLYRRAGRLTQADDFFELADVLFDFTAYLESEASVTVAEYPEHLIKPESRSLLLEELEGDRAQVELLLGEVDMLLQDLHQGLTLLDPERADCFPRRHCPSVEIKILADRFGLVDNIRPGRIYGLHLMQQRLGQLYHDLFEALIHESPEAPASLRQIFSKRLYRNWLKEKQVPPSLRMHVICKAPRVRKLEMSYYYQVLCLSKPVPIVEIPGLTELIAMFETALPMGEGSRSLLARIWQHFEYEFETSNPGWHLANFNKNKDSLHQFIGEMSLCPATTK